MTADHIASVYGEAETEYIIKKSRFLVHLKEVTTEAEVNAFLEGLRKQYWDASHNCYAYQLGLGGRIQKSSDDGEPSGTAGRPMLEVLKKNEITNTVAVITRYFGGVKLGASGLIRAYSHGVSLGLETAKIADYLPYTIYTLSFDYSFVSTLERLIPAQEAQITERTFTDKVAFNCQVPEEKGTSFLEAITNATNGRALYEDLGTKVLPIIRAK